MGPYLRFCLTPWEKFLYLLLGVNVQQENKKLESKEVNRMSKKLIRSLIFAVVVLLANYGISFSDHIDESILYDYYCPEDTHTYNYASILVFCKGDDPNSCPEGMKIGTNPVWPDSLFWSHTLPPGFLVPPHVITRARLWIDGQVVNTENNSICIQGTCDWEPLNRLTPDNATYDLSGVSEDGFWNQGSISVIVWAGESLVRLDHAKLLLDYTQDTTKPVLTCAGDELTCDSTSASATVISDPSVGVSYSWTPEPVSGQGTDHARYDTPGTKKVVVTILATGNKDSCEAEITQDITNPVLTCAGDSLTLDSTEASATVISDPSVEVSYFWNPEPVSGQGTYHARYNAPGTYEVVVTILATGCKDSCEAVIFGEPTDVEEEESSSPIGGFCLSQNYPNPFNPETQISFFLSERASVSLVVYNIFGQKVKGLISVIMPAGSYKVTWDGTDEQGNRLASGVYLCRLSAGGNSSTSKMVLVK